MAKIDLTLTLGLTATIDVPLKAGAVTETVLVEAAAIELERQTASLGNVMNSHQSIAFPPLNPEPDRPETPLPIVVGRVSSGNPRTGPVINGVRSNYRDARTNRAE